MNVVNVLIQCVNTNRVSISIFRIITFVMKYRYDINALHLQYKYTIITIYYIIILFIYFLIFSSAILPNE